MGRKHKHSKDKLYKTVSELHSHHIGPNRELDLSYLHRRLKFDTCCLSFNKISAKPVGLVDKTNFCYLFDSDFILKFLRRHRDVHPITGQHVTKNDLITLIFHKNPEGQYHCPITFKPLNQFSKIIANRKTGHIYSFDAYDQLNIKANHFKDLITDEPFTRSDIITIQDPIKADEKWNVKEFYHIKYGLKFSFRSDDESESGQDDLLPRHKTVKSSDIMTATFEEYNQQAKVRDSEHERLFGTNESDGIDRNQEKNLDKVNSAMESDGYMAKSVTSTVMPVVSTQLPALLNNEQILYPRVKKRGYIVMNTNLGQINIELLCDRTPRTCHNFLQLAEKGYYDNTSFHRLIKNFMIQGGDPTGTGKGGESAWGAPFEDECHRDLKHEGRGILAMANSGPNTNRSQFYITLKGNWPHLNGKHTVFGKVMGGVDTLHVMNEQEVNKNDKPKNEIKLVSIRIYQDPFRDIEKAIKEERIKLETSKRKLTSNRTGDHDMPMKRHHAGIGCYIDIQSRQIDTNLKNEKKVSKLDKKISSNKQNYGNFSNW